MKDQKVTFFRIAMNIAGLSVNDNTAELVYRICDAVMKSGNGLTIKDIVTIQMDVERNQKELEIVARKQREEQK